MADRIELTGLEATGYHGVFDFEKREGQRFIADITCWLNFPREDNLAGTVHYGELAELAHAVLTGPPADLIETVASTIAERAMETFPQLHAIEVRIHKPEAPIELPFRDVAVVARRSRRT
ncbi:MULTISPECIES: dihydroneopterin aldolase [Corynebacterium]|uniref:dihydroneopterin aldolase n=1 Tax=Corynebacterium TaxID=1716 RepID=UPI00124E7862|nr:MULTISPECIES: dihydroneopterin aldolase [Corynebacterium]